MAWPSTPLTTYVANSTPAIKAADLNAMQTGTNGIINATYNLQAVVTTTGTPGTVVVPVPGTVTLAGAGTGTTAPTTSVPQGRMYKDSVCIGWARGYWDGAAMVLTRGFNVLSLTRNSQGDYTVVFRPTVNSPATATAEVSLGVNPSVVDNGFVANIYDISDDGSSRVAVSFVTIDPNAATKLDTAATISEFYLSVRAN